MPAHNPRRELPRGTYALSIERWEYRYNFSRTSPETTPREAYAHSPEIVVTGTLKYPRKSAGRKMEMVLRSVKSLLVEDVGYHPDSVGYFIWSRNAGGFSGSLKIAEAQLASVIPLLIAGKIRHVLMDTAGPFRGNAEIARYDLIEEITDDYFE